MWEYRRSDGMELAPTQLANIHFSMEKGMRIIQVSFVHKRIISPVKRVEFVSDRVSYIILRERERERGRDWR
jgi:hypothetical protein